LIAVVKYQPLEKIQQLIDAGANRLAFNRIQEATEEIPRLRFHGKYHLIGHLQKNKVKKAVELFSWIQSVDSLALAEKIDTEAGKIGKRINVLLQVNIATDPDKHGFTKSELLTMAPELARLSHLTICGLMTIGKLDATEQEMEQAFMGLKELRDEIRLQKIFGDEFFHLSMGMSNDYELALKTGATFVRVGSALFK
jgi:pyridoxal phosphate enzyme (YggS family)